MPAALFLILLILFMPLILGVSCACTGCAWVSVSIQENQKKNTDRQDSIRQWENEEMDYKRLLVKKASGEEMYDIDTMKIELWPLRADINQAVVDKAKKEWDACKAMTGAVQGAVSAKTGGWMDKKFNSKKEEEYFLRMKWDMLNRWLSTRTYMEGIGAWGEKSEEPE